MFAIDDGKLICHKKEYFLSNTINANYSKYTVLEGLQFIVLPVVLAAMVQTEQTAEQWPVELEMLEHLDKIDLEIANVVEQVYLELKEKI